MSAQVLAVGSDDPARWCDRAGRDPDSALRKARRWLSRAAHDTEARVLARHVAGLASIERGSVTEGRRHVRLGLAVARRLGMRDMEVRLRLVLAWAELERGDVDACGTQLRVVQPLLGAGDEAKAACVRGMLHRHCDRYGSAVAELTTALESFERAGDRWWAATALLGRGLARTAGGWLAGAEDDLSCAERMFAAEGWQERAAYCVHNRGNVALRAGELPQALRLYASAVTGGLNEAARPEARAERAEALARAGRSSEARAELERAATNLAALGRTARLGEITQALAECDLRDNAIADALRSASEARRAFRAQRRPAWVALAVATQWRARVASGHRSRYTLAAARRAAVRCAAHGWIAVSLELQLACGRAADETGRSAAARTHFAAATRYRWDRSLPAPQRALGWLGAAKLADRSGDRDGVFDACGTGLQLIADHTATVRAADRRVHAAGLADELAAVVLGAAVRTGDPDVALYWSERCRAGTWCSSDSVPLADPDLRRALNELRSVVAGSNTHDSRTRSAGSAIAVLEDRVRDTATATDGGTAPVRPERDLADLSPHLGGRVLLSFFSVRGELYSVSAVEGRKQVVRHGTEAEIGAEIDRLRYCLQRQARATDRWVAEAFASSAREAAEALERALLVHLRDQRLSERELIIVPTGRLHMLPWASLPLCRGVAVTVAPSLRCWLRAREHARRGASGNRKVWVAGPGLEHADQEVRALRASAGGELLTGPSATAERVLREVDGAATVHIAAHGWFRADRPLLSCVDLADGPLYGYDLDRLGRGPTTVVLSACEVGRSAVSRGNQLRGLAAALLGRGTATVIASVVTVPDERTARVMLDLHAMLRRGIPPAAALAEAQQRHGESGFVCLGYGGCARGPDDNDVVTAACASA